MKFIPFLLAFLMAGCASFVGQGEEVAPQSKHKMSKHCSCSASSKHHKLPKNDVSLVKNANEIDFCAADGLKIKLRSYDDFNTSVLITNDGLHKALKRAASASGILLIGDDVQVHFKSNEGIYTINGKEISFKKCE